jgi:predicted nucleic acid-binding protein
MRLVVDTNVFVSAALKDNSLPFFVVRWIERHDGLLKSSQPSNSFWKCWPGLT